jgi:serine/threonine protein phosphatase PrpC
MFVATLLTSGTTATVALLRDGIELVVASVGDSRALLCRKGKPMKLTTDHTPERKDEKERYLPPRIGHSVGMMFIVQDFKFYVFFPMVLGISPAPHAC